MQKYRLLILPAILVTLLSCQFATAQGKGKDWQLVWSDEFDGPTLDYGKWEIEVNAFGGGTQELQIYTDRPENVRVEDGDLLIEARRDNHGISGTVREYSSGRIRISL